MKSQKTEGAKLNQGKGGVVSGEREPLFPRLHVNETEKAGPKAPPRNKMALYEQFTVPSHHFQPAQGSTSTVLLQPYGSGYSCIPYYVPSVAYGSANIVQAYTQPSQVTSSSGITVGSTVVNEESRKAPRHSKSEGTLSPGKVLRGLTESSTECLASDVPEKRGNFRESMTKTIGEYTSFLGNSHLGKERPEFSAKTVNSHKVVSASEKNTARLHQRNDVTKNGASKCQSDYFSTHLERSEGISKTTTSHVSVKSQTGVLSSKHDSTIQSLRREEHGADHSRRSSELKTLEKGGAIRDADDKNQLSAKDQSPGGPEPASMPASNQNPRTQTFSSVLKCSPDVKADQINSDLKALKEQTTKDNTCEVSHHAVSGPNDSLDGSMSSLKPKEVLFAIGQQQFWKARKTLLRQQRIFSDQVFQLHKLIMTQHLLAETPGTLIDEAVQFETTEECGPPAPSIPPGKGAAKHKGCACDEGCSRKESKSQTHDAEDSQLLSTGVEKEAKVGIPKSPHGGLSAWGYPSLGQWLGPGVQGQSYCYPPLGGAFSPGSVFGLPYGSTLSGSASPMVSFGIPFCGPQPEVTAEMGSNYGPAPISKLDASGLKSTNFGHFSNQFASSWNLMQQNALNNKRMRYGGSGKDAPTGSGASANKASVSAPQVVKTFCFPGLLHHRSNNSQAGVLSNTEGLDSSGTHSEISSPSIANKLACSSSSMTPSTTVTKKHDLKEGEAIGHCNDMVNLNQSHSCDSRRLGDEEEADVIVSSQGHSSCANGGSVKDSLGVGGCALELFPLVPSLSCSGQTRKQGSELGEVGQGCVIRAVPRRAIAASESAAGILLSLQQERQK